MPGMLETRREGPAVRKRIRPLTMVAAVIGAIACSDPAGPGAYDYDIDFAALIADAAHQAGVNGFYFLPPIVANPGPFEGQIDAGLAPEVWVYEGATCDGEAIRVFTRETAVPVSLEWRGQAYQVLWRTAADGLSNGNVPDYRICVRAGAALLGWADLDVVADRKQLSQMSPDNIGVAKDAPLLIRFRIEQGVLGGIEVPVAPAATNDEATYAIDAALDGAAGVGGLLDNDDVGEPEAALLSYGGIDLGGSVDSHPAGSTIAPLPGRSDGSLTVLGNGSFSFVPPSSHTGSFRFRYRIGNSAGMSDAEVAWDAAPEIVATAPAASAVDVDASIRPSIEFSEAVTATSDAFALECNGATVAFTTSAGPATSYVLTPMAELPAGATCTLRVVAACISDTDAIDPPDSPAEDVIAAFTTATPAVVATDDAYPSQVIGNVPSGSAGAAAGAFSVLANDVLSASAVISAYDATTANGGTVTMMTAGVDAGTFVYSPARGFEGDDSFTYTVSDGGASSTATVTLTVDGMIWFVDNEGACASTCDGRLTHPYPSLAAFVAANDGAGANPGDGDAIFLFESGTPYTGPITLRDGQLLIGQDASVDLASAAGLAAAPGAQLPAMTPSDASRTEIAGASGIVLGSSNTVRGLRVNATAGAAMSGSTAGDLAILDVARLEASGGAALDVQGASSLNGTIGTLVSTGSAAYGVRIEGVASGTLTVPGPVSVAGSATAGVRLLSNGASFAFGRLDIAPAAGGRALHVSEQIGAIAAGGGTIAASGAVAVEIASAGAATPLAIVLTSVSADGGAHAIRLRRTSGSIEVRGGGASDPTILVGRRGRTTAGEGGGVIALGSGGSIRNTTGDAVSIEDAAGVTLRNMVIGDAASAGQPADVMASVGADGVDLTNAGVTLDNVLIAHTAGHAVRGTSVSDLRIVNSELLNAGDAAGEHAISLTEPRDESLIMSSILDGMWGRGIDLRVDGKSSGTAQDALLLTNVDIANGNAGGLHFDSQVASNYRIEITDSRIEDVGDEAVTVLSRGYNSADRSRVHLAVRRTAIAVGATAIRLHPSVEGAATFDISNNNAGPGNGGGFTALTAAGVIVRNDSNGELSGIIDGNLVESAAEPLSAVANGSSGGVSVTGATRVRITNNTFTSGGSHGMSLVTQNGGVTLNALIGGNTASAGGGFFDFQNGIYIETRSGTGCFNFSTAHGAGNNVATGSGPGVAEGIFLFGTGGQPWLEGLATSSDAAAQTFLDANNTNNAGASVFTGDMVAAGTCIVP